MELASTEAPGLLDLPREVIAHTASLTGCNHTRACLKLACRALYQNSQQHASTWHPYVGCEALFKQPPDKQRELAANLAAFLVRYRPQLQGFMPLTVTRLVAHLGVGVLEDCIFPCCSQVEDWNLAPSLDGAEPPPLHTLVSLRELDLGWRMPPSWPPSLTSLNLDMREVFMVEDDGEEEFVEEVDEVVVHPVPPCIAGLTTLRSLNVEGCSGFQHLPPSLISLRISGEGLRARELAHVTALCSLERLFLGCPEDEDGESLEALPDLSSMTALQDLDMSGTIIAGVNCAHIPPCLTRLRLEGMHAFSAPAQLRQLATLEVLSLSYTDAPALAVVLANLPPGLASLAMDECTMPEGQVSLPQLQRLIVGCTDMRGFAFECLPPTLTWLELEHSKLVEVPAALQQLTALQHLSLFDNGQLAAGYGRLPLTLTSLVLEGCGLTALPAALQQLTALRYLTLASYLSPTLSRGFEHLPCSLTRLALPPCIPPVPPELWQLTALRELRLEMDPNEIEGLSDDDLPPDVDVDLIQRFPMLC